MKDNIQDSLGTTGKLKITNVELSLAWVFDCPECGEENFKRSVSGVLSKEQFISTFNIEDEEEIESFDNGMNYHATAPTYIKCHFCGRAFLTTVAGLESE